MVSLSIDSEDSGGLFVCFHVHPSSSSLSRSIFFLTPFRIHVLMLATSRNDGLKQTPGLVEELGTLYWYSWFCGLASHGNIYSV